MIGEVTPFCIQFFQGGECRASRSSRSISITSKNSFLSHIHKKTTQQHLPLSSISTIDTRRSIQRKAIWKLFSSSASSSSKSSSSSSSSDKSSPSSALHKVVFQKVIRPPSQLKINSKSNHESNNQLVFFLPSLINYLQDTYSLPINLPITYETCIPADDDDDGDDDGEVEEETSKRGGGGQEYTILEIKSPLALKDDLRFRLFVEVIGLYTSSDSKQNNSDENNSNNNNDSIPSMAMVVIKTKESNPKEGSTTGVGNDIIRQRLFQDSIDKIIDSLDVGLDAYASGEIPIGLIDSSSNNSNKMGDKTVSMNIDIENDDGNWMGLDEYEGLSSGDEWKDIEPLISSPSTSSYNMDEDQSMNMNKKDQLWDKDVVIDATFSTTTETDDNKKKQEQLWEEESISERKEVETVPQKDFAVKAAQEVMKKRIRKTEEDKEEIGGGDFAVEAAKLAAQMAKKGNDTKVSGNVVVEAAKKSSTLKNDMEEIDMNKKSSTSTNTESEEKVIQTVTQSEQALNSPSSNIEDMLPQVSPMLKKGMGHHYTNPNAFRMSISDPTSFSKRQSSKRQKSNDIESKAEANESKIKTVKNANTSQINNNNEREKKNSLNVVVDDTLLDPNQISDDKRQKQLNNLPLQNFMKNSQVSKEKPKSEGIQKTTEEIEQDIYKAALEIMPGVDGGVNDGNDDDGSISAEDLLRNVLKFDEEKTAEEADGSGFVDGALNKAKELMALEKEKEAKTSTSQLEYDVESKSQSMEEEELKRIFAAGQKIADGRISLSTTASKASNDQMSQTKEVVTDEYVDELINADETVPSYARSLDDELAELELRISRSPDEDLDQGNNALFDIFSGPEVYNPNVDPETAVNWPGAVPGTRTDVKLPRELEMALTNARFAADILSKIVEERGDFNFATQKNKEKLYINGKEISPEQIKKLQKCVEEGIAVGLIKDPFEYLREKSRLDMVINELTQQPQERFGEIIINYKDLLLSDNFPILLREKLRSTTEAETELQEAHRDIMGKMVQYAQLLLKEARALGAELEASQLEIIRSICQVAMDPKHKTEEETSIALTDAVREMKPLLDENFVAYLKYAIAEEQGRLARAGLLDDPDHNRWLFVLMVVQEGVYAELSKGVQRFIDHIEYVLRMETKAERKQLLSKLIEKMPSMDIRPFVKVIDNIAASLGAESRGEFDSTTLGGMSTQILQLRRDVHDVLPPERIQVLSKEADAWAARQREKLLELRGLSQQRLKAASESHEYDEYIQRGEIERFD